LSIRRRMRHVEKYPCREGSSGHPLSNAHSTLCSTSETSELCLASHNVRFMGKMCACRTHCTYIRKKPSKSVAHCIPRAGLELHCRQCVSINRSTAHALQIVWLASTRSPPLGNTSSFLCRRQETGQFIIDDWARNLCQINRNLSVGCRLRVRWWRNIGGII